MSADLINDLEQARAEIKRLNHALALEKLKTEISSEFSNFGLWEYDPESKTSFQLKKLNGKYQDNLEPIPNFYETVKSWGIVHADDMGVFKRFCESMDAGDDTVGCDIRVIGGDFELVWFRYEGRTIRDESGKPIKVIGRTLDVTAEKGGVADSTTGKTDPLTDTYNVDVFREHVKERRSGSKRYESSALLYVGIDCFRDVMAHQGQEYTDYLQKTIGKMLKDFCFSERDALVARVRGGEFIVYLGAKDLKQTEEAAKKIISAVDNYIFNGAAATISIGISMFKSGKQSVNVYTESVLACTEAEKSGGGRFMVYSAAMAERSRKTEIFADTSAAVLTSGAAAVYDMLVRSFSSEHERGAAFKAALKAAGKYIGAAKVFTYYLDANGLNRVMTYSADERGETESPCLEITGTDEQILKIFSASPSVSIIGSENAPEGLGLKNGAVCAELRAVCNPDSLAVMFAFIFETNVEISDESRKIINVLGTSLASMFGEYTKANAHNIRRQLNSTIINDHRIEGFTIIPGEFIVDYAGVNAVEHYGMKKGDVCYKKVRGLDAPCEGCPAAKLDTTDEDYASAALYIDSDRRWLDVAASVSENMLGERRYVVSSTDITGCLGKIQMTDQLTGLMTFNVFISEALKLTTAEKRTNGAHRFSIVMNIAEFNRLNEERGFEVGNGILTTAADILSPCMGEGELICHAEDSRFVMTVVNEDIDRLYARLSILMSSIQTHVYEKFGVTIYLLVGICDMTESAVSVMTSIDRAIIAQKTVRNRFTYRENLMVLYDNAMRERIRERREIEENMYTALANNEFTVYYQPKVNIGTGKVVGAEALVRWIKPDGSVVSPGKFIPIFEENGFITEMDFAVYRGAVTDIANWLREGVEIPLISLNVSRRHLTDDDFCERFNSLVDEVGVPHEHIELEITESLLTENVDKLVAMATWFKEKGYRISIDDFGSGYSSLNLITMLPFDTLKIDGGFFLKNDLTEKNKKVITSVVTLAKSLNLTTVSEGVETQVQVDFLRDLGCDMVQGFFYYKPMPGNDFRKLLES